MPLTKNTFSIFFLSSVCVARLGMEDGRIPNSQITASSVHDNRHHQTNARLNHHADNVTKGAWSAGVYNNLTQWIQVDLGVAQMVSGVMLQGREEEDQWVTRYKVQHGYHDMFAMPEYPEFEDELVSYDLHIYIVFIVNTKRLHAFMKKQYWAIYHPGY